MNIPVLTEFGPCGGQPIGVRFRTCPDGNRAVLVIDCCLANFLQPERLRIITCLSRASEDHKSESSLAGCARFMLCHGREKNY